MIELEPFKTWDMWATPPDRAALDAYVANYTGNEKVIAHIVMGITWNFAVMLFNKRLEEFKKRLEEQDNE